MTEPSLVERLRALPPLGALPVEELEWLAEHGVLEAHEAGTVLAPKGEPIGRLWILLSGQVVVRVDRGTGPRRVAEWAAGEVSGMLPYSRMKGPPGDNVVEADTELVAIQVDDFPEMVHRCPTFTAGTVHSMLDRARTFNASALHDEKMVSLGKLAAGLAHELNNPASAAVRSASMLQDSLREAEAAARSLGGDVPDAVIDAVERLSASRSDAVAEPSPSPLELADREDELAEWLAARGVEPALAGSLVGMGLTGAELETLCADVSTECLDGTIRWMAARGAAYTLAEEIRQATSRIHELVSVVKKFTFMDGLAGRHDVDVVGGLRDTIEVMASKASSRGVTVKLDADEGLPLVAAPGGDLNQVWMSLLDNALDAASEGGTVEVSACAEPGVVVVRVVDDGVGIAPEVLPRVFDPFFTTKAPGRGTGLGLEIAQRLVRGSRGEISVSSRPGRTELCVRLPAVEEGASRHDPGGAGPGASDPA